MHKRTATLKQQTSPHIGGGCNIISGGFPCQPFSEAGKKKGTDDSRYLWPDMLRAIREVQPKYIVGENVPGLISWNNGAVYQQICTDLENEGYEVCPIIIPAYAIGAQHERKRIWFVGRSKMEANTNTTGGIMGKIPNQVKEEGPRNSTQLFGNDAGLHWHASISRIHGNLNGISRRMDRHRNAALGNAIVPFLAYQIFKTIQLIESAK